MMSSPGRASTALPSTVIDTVSVFAAVSDTGRLRAAEQGRGSGTAV